MQITKMRILVRIIYLILKFFNSCWWIQKNLSKNIIFLNACSMIDHFYSKLRFFGKRNLTHPLMHAKALRVLFLHLHFLFPECNFQSMFIVCFFFFFQISSPVFLLYQTKILNSCKILSNDVFLYFQIFFAKFFAKFLVCLCANLSKFYLKF